MMKGRHVGRVAALIIVVAALRLPVAVSEVRPAEACSSETAQPPAPAGLANLPRQLQSICDRAEGSMGVAVLHVETGRSVDVRGSGPLPLYSVFKLPLAVAVVQAIEAQRLTLHQRVMITPADVSPGWQGNTNQWGKPVEKTVSELLELSIVRSDNTASDHLLRLVGGPSVVTARMHALGLKDIEIVSASDGRPTPNTGSPLNLVLLLAKLHQGEVLEPAHRALLLGLMQRSTTGVRRLRGDLPAGTPVASKTGTGENGKATNDVGLITLPGNAGHLAIAVLISGSKLSTTAQEKLIAEVARTAFQAPSAAN